MKTNLVTQGSVELSPAEVQEALMKYALEEKKLTAIIDNYLLSKNLTTKRITHTQTKDGLVVVAEVSGATADRLSLPSANKPVKRSTTGKAVPVGFTRKNVGFSDVLSTIISDYRKARKKKVSFDEVLGELQHELPALDRKGAYIYISDRRLQEKLKFEFIGNKGAKQLVL